MNEMNRRGFFSKYVIGRVQDAFSPKFQEISQKTTKTDGWKTIGRLSLFPVDTTVHIPDLGVTISSSAEGLCARASQSGEHRLLGPIRPIKIDQTGQLWVDVEGGWPEGSVFSVMTNERVQLEKEKAGS